MAVKRVLVPRRQDYSSHSKGKTVCFFPSIKKKKKNTKSPRARGFRAATLRVHVSRPRENRRDIVVSAAGFGQRRIGVENRPGQRFGRRTGAIANNNQVDRSETCRTTRSPTAAADDVTTGAITAITSRDYACAFHYRRYNARRLQRQQK